MGMKEIESAILDLRFIDDNIESPGMCRYAAEKMLEVASDANKIEPKAIIEILVWKEASPTETEIHYALQVSYRDGEKIVFNPNPATLFPQYIGPIYQAPGLIPQMRVTKKVL
jgi:hypothetical protein